MNGRRLNQSSVSKRPTECRRTFEHITYTLTLTRSRRRFIVTQRHLSLAERQKCRGQRQKVRDGTGEGAPAAKIRG